MVVGEKRSNSTDEKWLIWMRCEGEMVRGRGGRKGEGGRSGRVKGSKG